MTLSFSSSDQGTHKGDDVLASTYDSYAPAPFRDLDELPSHWDTAPNLVLFETRNERDYDELDVYSVTQDRGVVPQASLEYSIAEASKDRSNYKHIKPGDLVYNKMRMWQGAVGRSPAKGIVSPAYVVLRPQADVDSRYYAYLYQSEFGLAQSNRHSYGIVDDQNSLRATDFMSLRTLVPPPDEQKEIADALDRQCRIVDGLIEKKREIIELLKEKRTALITRAVTKGLDPDAPMKESQLERIGKIPLEWEVVKLQHLVKRWKTGSTPSTGKSEYYDGDIPWYSPTSLRDQIEIGEPVKSITRRAVEYGEAPLYPEGTVLVGTIASIGEIGLLQEPGSANQQLTGLVPNTDVVLPRFLAYQLQIMSQQIQQLASSTTMAIVNQNDLKQLAIAVPPGDVQAKIVRYLDENVDRLSELVTSIDSAVALLDEYRSTVITSAVTGKIDVRDHAA